MHRIIVLFFLVTLSLSHAQTLMPARQVSVSTNEWEHINPATLTVQSSLDWLDVNSYSNVLNLETNISLLSTNFSLIASDLSVLETYFLGGHVSNAWTNVSWNVDGSAEDAAVIPALQHNQDITKSNFELVNTNTYWTTNVFLSIVSRLMGLADYETINTNEASQFDIDMHSAYTNFLNQLSAFQWMDTDYTELPVNMELLFPSVFDHLTVWTDTIDDKLGQPFIDRFHGFDSATGTITLSHTNGPYQFVDIVDDNVELSFAPPPEGTPFTLELWIRNSGAYTNVMFTGNLEPHSDAFDPSGTNVTVLNRYHSSPFLESALWYEEAALPGSGYVAPSPPATETVGVTFSGENNVDIDITEAEIGGVNRRIYTIETINPASNGSLTFTVDDSATWRVLVVGGGGGGGNNFGGGGGGGVVNFQSAVTLAPNSYAVTVGARGDQAAHGSPSEFWTYSAEGGRRGITAGVYGSPGGNGGASGTASGGVRAPYAGGGGAASGSIPGGNASGSTHAPDNRGGNGANGVLVNVRGVSERVGAGGGGGVWTHTTRSSGGAGGGGRGGNNGINALNGSGWGAGGGGGGPGMTNPDGGRGSPGVVILSHPIE